jgi:hypothetical protein
VTGVQTCALPISRIVSEGKAAVGLRKAQEEAVGEGIEEKQRDKGDRRDEKEE